MTNPVPTFAKFAVGALMTISFQSPAFAVDQATPVAPAATEMSCAVGVITAKDAITQAEGTEPSHTTQVISLPLVDGEGDQEYVINGETVAVSMYKKEFADLYHVDILLLTPKSELPPRGPQFHASIMDYLVNEGPAKDNGWTIKPGPNATKFGWLNYQGGSFGMSHKLQRVLKAEGKWGTYPFTSMMIDVNNLIRVADEIQPLVTAGKLQESDVLGIYTAFTCTLNK